MSRLRVCLLLLCAGMVGYANAEDVDYLRDIKPILRERCFACHGALKQEANLRLDTGDSIVQGGDSGPAIQREAVEESLILQRLTASDDERMPPEGEALTQKELNQIREWISHGAESPANERPQADPRDHWAFQRPKAPSANISPSQIPDRANRIDTLLGELHREHGLAPQPLAEKNILLRRVYLDLIGVPPTAQQLQSFLADQAPDAYERQVDRLLTSPRYGERWGRHWMDIWRYSDWSGEVNNQVRGSPKHIWRWRDWIVESLNADHGYDQLIREMLAADELWPHDRGKLRATGFLARNWYKFNRNVWLDDTIEHTSKAFLGLTFNCAKCHDHKYDPISQQNYYQLRAFFEPHDIRIDPAPGEKDTKKDGLVRILDVDLDAPTFLFHRGQESQPDKSQTIVPALPEVFQSQVAIQTISISTSEESSRTSSGRRAALANWIANRRNPLTARVAINHIWMRHFGKPIVNATTDFGLRSSRPALAPMLDHLAYELMHEGHQQEQWEMKRIHRQIVLSSAYRRASTPDAQRNVEIDPDNNYFWRMNARRMESEAVRDSILHLAQQLDWQMGGQEVPLDLAETSSRRSIYFRHGHERQIEFLKTFDGASVLECYRRNSTVTPQQALALANSEMVRRQALAIAELITRQHDQDEQFVRAAFLHLLNRPPTQLERSKCLTFLQSQTQLIRQQQANQAEDDRIDPRSRARQGLAHVLLNHNDFVSRR